MIKPSSKQATTTYRRSVRSGGDKLTSFIKPMLAQLHDEVFDDEAWIFEIKWDGYRAVAELDGKNIKLYSRNGLSFLQLYPKVVEALENIKEKVVLDGEIIVLNNKNKPDFQKLQQYGDNRNLKMIYYVFDCLSYQGKSIMNLPLIERKKIASKVVAGNNVVVYADHVNAEGKDFFKAVVSMDLEGMIAKRANSIYRPGKRSKDWLKIKNHNTQEAVICGYTAPRGSRSYFGALILGIYQNKKLTYIGHTGTGFTEELLKSLYKKFESYKTDTNPFGVKVPVNGGVTWLKPELVCNVKFTEITEEGILRHPVFQGLRVDKEAKEADKLDKRPAFTSKEKIPSNRSKKK